MIKYITLPVLIKKPTEDAIDWEALNIPKPDDDDDDDSYEFSDERFELGLLGCFYPIIIEEAEQVIVRTVLGEVQVNMTEAQFIDKIQKAYDEYSKGDTNIIYSGDRQNCETNTNEGYKADILDNKDMD